MTRQADIEVQDHGSIVLLVPLSPLGEAWLATNIDPNSSYQPNWPTVLCEPRYVWDIVDGMEADGLVIKEEHRDDHKEPTPAMGGSRSQGS